MVNVRSYDLHISLMCLKSMNNPTLIFWNGKWNLLKKEIKKEDRTNGREIQQAFKTLYILYVWLK